MLDLVWPMYSPPTINASMVNIGGRLLAPGAMRETLVEEGV